MTRDEMIAALSWSDDLHLFRLPTRFASACGDPSGWTDAELALMLGFSERRQADYHARCGNSKFDWADNFITVMREDRDGRVRWSRKRSSWRGGVYWSPSLPEAIGAFAPDEWRQLDGRFALTASGDVVRILGHAGYDGFKAPLYHDLNVERLRDGARRRISRNSDIVMTSSTVTGLGDDLRMAVEHRIASAGRPDADEVAASRAAFGEGSDPAVLERMWTSRVWSFREREEALVTLPRAA